MSYKTYLEAKQGMKELLYENDLYREGQVTIIFDKEDNDFYIAQFPLVSNVYIANNEISIIYVNVKDLDEHFKENKSVDCTEKERWELTVDYIIDTAEEEQIFDEKVDIVKNVGVIQNE